MTTKLFCAASARRPSAAFAAALLFALTIAGCGTPSATIKDRQGRAVMLLGYDPVAYFVNGVPAPGRSQFAVNTRGRTYYFASEANRALFEAAPQKYEPQYGGFCANGTPFKVKLGSDPTQWEVFQDRLFIFGDLGGRETWKLDREQYVRWADTYWPEIESAGWRGQSIKAIFLSRVPHYRTGADQVRRWEAAYGKPFPREKHGNMFLHLGRAPGWRAAVGYGMPAVGWPDDRQ